MDNTAEAQRAWRTPEIEEPTNRYVIHPLSWALVQRLARWGVHPNTVSLVGLALGAGAAVAYYHYTAWQASVLGFLLMIGWHVMDGADGQLARLTGRTSEIGKVLDGLCDHGTFVLIYLSLALATYPSAGWMAWVLAVLAGGSHVVQASTYEFQRQSYDYWVHNKRSARPVTPEAFYKTLAQKRGLARWMGWLYWTYLRVQYGVGAADRELMQLLEKALAQLGYPEKVRQMYRFVHRPLVRRWALMSSNYRTLAIFFACLYGKPLAFFVFELVGLNLIFLVLVIQQRIRNRRFRSWLRRQLEAKPADVWLSR
ncbi:CDP-alcohol phosphatidyltransferase family protein [Rhodothermus profundi]|uniref:Phosphatidylglycerophosphate synthase n=1 Tax=Rhodothermus profundi TaxID=633813 RepID=A0A1M6P7W0_9BACT|nr:CDP-alcohol phosphatidyltransferase family protein [Rhodothermus profundi]SHK03993.1 Phosphatidylglycerophosphate synthase [Rhodothermus profundi]